MHSNFSLDLLCTVGPVPVADDAPDDDSIVVGFLLFLLVFIRLFFAIALAPPVRRKGYAYFVLCSTPRVRIYFPLGERLPKF